MKDQVMHEQKEKSSVSNLTTGNWIIIISGCLFIVSLFLDWNSAGGFLISKGIANMNFGISISSGLPMLHPLTLLAAIGCILLCIPFLKQQDRTKYRTVPIIQIFLSLLGLLPFVLLPFELKTWLPTGQMETGGWLAILTAVGLLIGSILTMNETRHE